MVTASFSIILRSFCDVKILKMLVVQMVKQNYIYTYSLNESVPLVDSQLFCKIAHML